MSCENIDYLLDNTSPPKGFVPIQGEIVCHDNDKICVSINFEDWKAACEKHFEAKKPRKERDIFPTIVDVEDKREKKKAVKGKKCICAYPKPADQPCDKECQCDLTPRREQDHKASQYEYRDDRIGEDCRCDQATSEKAKSLDDLKSVTSDILAQPCCQIEIKIYKTCRSRRDKIRKRIGGCSCDSGGQDDRRKMLEKEAKIILNGCTCSR